MKNKLNRDVCKKCRNNQKYIQWTNLDDRLWDEAGFVKCGKHIEYIGYYNINDELPEGCVMKLEHTILRQGMDK